jgi:sterol carrier protein 2
MVQVLTTITFNLFTKFITHLLNLFESGGAEGYWVINAKEGKGKITYNGAEKPDVTFIINDKDVTELIKGEINPQKAFFQGKVKISGNMGLAMKLVDLQRTAQHRIEELRIKHKL